MVMECGLNYTTSVVQGCRTDAGKARGNRKNVSTSYKPYIQAAILCDVQKNREILVKIIEFMPGWRTTLLINNNDKTVV